MTARDPRCGPGWAAPSSFLSQHKLAKPSAPHCASPSAAPSWQHTFPDKSRYPPVGAASWSSARPESARTRAISSCTPGRCRRVRTYGLALFFPCAAADSTRQFTVARADARQPASSGLPTRADARRAPRPAPRGQLCRRRRIWSVSIPRFVPRTLSSRTSSIVCASKTCLLLPNFRAHEKV